MTPRPPKPATRPDRITIRVSAEERREIDAAAEADERKPGDWVRVVALRAARQRSR